MDDLQDVYNDLIMEHSMNSYNKKKKLETCDLCEMGHNPNCGDEIELQVKLNGDVIEDMAFFWTWMCYFSGFYFNNDRYSKR